MLYERTCKEDAPHRNPKMGGVCSESCFAPVKVKVEWRLCVKRWGGIRRYLKRDQQHAEKGLVDAVIDGRRAMKHGLEESENWLETRVVTEWERHDDTTT